VPGEETGVEGQRKQTREPELARGRRQLVHQQVAVPVPAMVWVNRQCANLPQVSPQNVQGAASDHHAAQLGDPEVRYVLIEGDQLFREQLASGTRVDINKRLDRRHIGRARAAHCHDVLGSHGGQVIGRKED
jgi:hypothetical protein